MHTGLGGREPRGGPVGGAVAPLVAQQTDKLPPLGAHRECQASGRIARPRCPVSQAHRAVIILVITSRGGGFEPDLFVPSKRYQTPPPRHCCSTNTSGCNALLQKSSGLSPASPLLAGPGLLLAPHRSSWATAASEAWPPGSTRAPVSRLVPRPPRRAKTVGLRQWPQQQAAVPVDSRAGRLRPGGQPGGPAAVRSRW